MKAETKFDVAGVLALEFDKWINADGFVDLCVSEIPEAASVMTAAISAHIAETLGSSDAREFVGMAIWRDDRPVSTPGTYANAALAAVGDLLGVEVGR